MSGRCLFYTYDAMGLGHVRRALSLSRAVLRLRPDIGALLLTCSPLIDALPVPPGLDYIKLPSARKLGNGRYESRTLPLSSSALRIMRSRLIRDAAESFEPGLVHVDKSPLGLMDELRHALHALRAPGGARLLLGWRDILDEPAAVRREWSLNGTLESVARYYDEIWVYGDPDFFDVRVEYALPEALASRVRHLGYLAPEPDEPSRRALRSELLGDGDALAVVTPGGGEDGDRVVAAYLEAARRGLLPPGLRSLVVTGPAMPPSLQADLLAGAPAGVRVEAFRPNLAEAVAAADVVVGMGGYNTVCEAMGGRTRLVLVPRRAPRLEQWVRAVRLEARGLCEIVAAEAAPLAEAVRRALSAGPIREGLPAIDGLDRVAREVSLLVPRGLPPDVAGAARAARALRGGARS